MNLIGVSEDIISVGIPEFVASRLTGPFEISKYIILRGSISSDSVKWNINVPEFVPNNVSVEQIFLKSLFTPTARLPNFKIKERSENHSQCTESTSNERVQVSNICIN